MQRLMHHFKSALTLALVITTMSTHGMNPQFQIIKGRIGADVQETIVEFEGREAIVLAEKLTERNCLMQSGGNYFLLCSVALVIGSLSSCLGFDDSFLVSLAIPALISIPGIWKFIKSVNVNTSIEKDVELKLIEAIQLNRLHQENMTILQYIEPLPPVDRTFTNVVAKSGEPESGIGISDLPQDIHNEIINMALASSNTLEETIKAINVANTLRGARYDNLKDFTKLVHILAKEFGFLPSRVAEKFKTSTARKYIGLGRMLSTSAKYSEFGLKHIVSLIEKGADINFMDYVIFNERNHDHLTLIPKGNESPLKNAVKHQNAEIVKFLLDSGANVIPYHLDIEAWAWDGAKAPEEVIEKMLYEALQRRRQNLKK